MKTGQGQDLVDDDLDRQWKEAVEFAKERKRKGAIEPSKEREEEKAKREGPVDIKTTAQPERWSAWKGKPIQIVTSPETAEWSPKAGVNELNETKEKKRRGSKKAKNWCKVAFRVFTRRWRLPQLLRCRGHHAFYRCCFPVLLFTTIGWIGAFYFPVLGFHLLPLNDWPVRFRLSPVCLWNTNSLLWPSLCIWTYYWLNSFKVICCFNSRGKLALQRVRPLPLGFQTWHLSYLFVGDRALSLLFRW